LAEMIQNQEMPKRYFTTAEEAVRLGKSEFTIQQYCRDGILKAHKSSHAFSGPYAKWVIPYSEIVRFEGGFDDPSGEGSGPAPRPVRPKNSPKGPPMRKQLEWPVGQRA
jgi:hypothetical protein